MNENGRALMAAHASLGYPALLELISKDAADHENPSCASSPDCATDLASNLMASVTLRMTHRSDIIELFDEYAKTFDKAPTRLVALARTNTCTVLTRNVCLFLSI